MIDSARSLTPKSNAKSSRRIIREKIPRGRKNRHRDIKFPLDLGEASKMCATMSVIFPAFNEEGNIRRTVEAAVKVLPKIAMSWEIIVANDGSKIGRAHV